MESLSIESAHILSNTSPGAFPAFCESQEVTLLREAENKAVMSMKRMGDFSEVEVTWTTTSFGPVLEASLITALVPYGRELKWADHFVRENRIGIMAFFKATYKKGKEAYIQ